MPVSTDPKKIKELLERGVEAIYPTKEFLEKALMSGRQLRLYVGYDPTAPTLHVGNGVTLLKLRQFQELGHKVILLIGDFTAMIGDPTDKSAVRKKLTQAEVQENCKLYQKQASIILNFSGKNPAELQFNSSWLSRLSFGEVLELCSHFTVQRMLERDMFERRLAEAKPVYLHEFMYPLMQGYDSVAMDVDGEVGGNDQTFNMLAGRDLVKALKHKEKFVMPMKILADEHGVKMGKTEGNMVAFTDSPADMFGKIMRWTDGTITPGFELCTTVSMSEVTSIAKQLRQGVNPRDLKLRLAFEITRTFLGEAAAKQGQEHFAHVIQDKERPTDIPSLKPSRYDIVTALVESKIVKSKSEARRDITQGGVKINDKKVTDPEQKVSAGEIIQKGKRWFVKIL